MLRGRAWTVDAPKLTKASHDRPTAYAPGVRTPYAQHPSTRNNETQPCVDNRAFRDPQRMQLGSEGALVRLEMLGPRHFVSSIDGRPALHRGAATQVSRRERGGGLAQRLLLLPLGCLKED